MNRRLNRWSQREAQVAIRTSQKIVKTSEIDVNVVQKTAETSRVLVVTPRKSGNAVERNRFRRRIKAIFQSPDFNPKGYDWIFFAKPGIASLSFEDLYKLVYNAAQGLSAPVSSSSSP